ncbi:MAG: GAF domain-containing protein [Chloroflexi bacterium]|nr:GAF domain-containing protein [Chloroflexota bacterium]
MSAEAQATERERASLDLLYAISRELTGELDLRDLLQRVLDLTMTNVGALSGSILVLDEEGKVSEGALAYDGKVHDQTAERLAETFEQGLAGWVVENREAARVANTFEDKRWLNRHPEEENGNPRSAISAPLLARDRIVGVVTLVHPQPEHFTEADADLLRAIADQAGIAVENARLFRAEQDRKNFALTLQEIARIINSALDPGLVFDQVLRQLARVVDYDSASIFVLEDDSLRLVSSIGLEDGDSLIGVRLMKDPDVLAWKVMASDVPIMKSDVQEEPGWVESDSMPGAKLMRGWIGAPLVLREKAVGLLSLDSREVDAFDKHDLEVVTGFADHAATAVANAQLFADSQRQLEATRALAETARAVTATLQLEEVLQRILSETTRSLDCEGASLALIDEETGELEFRNALGVAADKIIGLKLQKGEGIAGWVAEHDEPLVVPDVKADERFYSGADEEAGFETRTIAAVPISVQRHIIGVLEAVNPRSHEFPPLYLELLRSIAGLAGTAITHAQLFSETQAARLRYAGLFEDSIDPILISDLNGRVTDANHRAESFLGYSSAALLGRSVLGLHKPNEQRLPEDLSQLELGQTISYESEAELKDANSVPIEIYVKRIDIERKPYLQWIMRDISERLALDELRADLTSMIFHDLRSPLGNVLSSLEVLKSSMKDDDEALQTVLAIALRSGRRLSRLIEQLLDLEQLEAGQAVLHKSSGSLGTLVVEAVEEVHPVAEGKGHVLNFDLGSDNIPLVEMDAEMIRRVLINLLENAIKYSRAEGKISVTLDKLDNELRVGISDNGPGVPSEDQTRIFEKFARVQRKGRPKGLGLGLAFCRLAVEAHEGRIWVESQPGQGSTFYFTLPI